MRPIVDVCITREGDAWRLHSAPFSSALPVLARRMNDRREVYPFPRFDFEELRALMWQSDCPFEHRRLANGLGWELRAKGRAAITLGIYLADLAVTP